MNSWENHWVSILFNIEISKWLSIIQTHFHFSFKKLVSNPSSLFILQRTLCSPLNEQESFLQRPFYMAFKINNTSFFTFDFRFTGLDHFLEEHLRPFSIISCFTLRMIYQSSTLSKMHQMLQHRTVWKQMKTMSRGLGILLNIYQSEPLHRKGNYCLNGKYFPNGKSESFPIPIGKVASAHSGNGHGR